MAHSATGFVFSKDRPQSLRATCESLVLSNLPVTVLDDSTSEFARSQIRRICSALNIEYHGPTEQSIFLGALDDSLKTILRVFVRSLGSPEWSLGFNRNYALLLAKARRISLVFFADDDVTIQSPNQITMMRDELSKLRFIGTEISAMPDCSLLDHIYLASGTSVPTFVSGGFLGMRVDHLQHYFLNVYNEDWIWLFLETKGCQPKQVGNVRQAPFDPFAGWKDRAAFQEPGEVMWKGVSSLEQNFTCLTNADFWREIMIRRREEILRVSRLPLPDSLRALASDIQTYLFGLHERMSPVQFAGTFETYFALCQTWRELLPKLEAW